MQRTGRRHAELLGRADVPAVLAECSPEFVEREGEAHGERVRSIVGARLIGTVGTRTLVNVDLDDGRNQTFEMLWREIEGARLIDDLRVWSLIPDQD